MIADLDSAQNFHYDLHNFTQYLSLYIIKLDLVSFFLSAFLQKKVGAFIEIFLRGSNIFICLRIWC
jgi:formate/nitrite transporter FocA (FNT family)